MRELETSITQKGQVTIPAEIRAKLQLKPRDKVQFEIDGDTVKLRKAPSRIQRHFGSVVLPTKPLEWREEREAFEEAVAEEVISEG